MHPIPATDAIAALKNSARYAMVDFGPIGSLRDGRNGLSGISTGWWPYRMVASVAADQACMDGPKLAAGKGFTALVYQPVHPEVVGLRVTAADLAQLQ